MAASRKWMVAVFAAIMVFCAAATALTFSASGSADAAGVFVKNDEIKIAQITDTHYYPLNYCYSGGNGNTDFDKQLIGGTKLFLESSFFVRQMLDDMVAEKPDYLFVTGDITLNGELQAHIEMANLLRDVQNKIRAAGKPGFQVFVTTGNHDLYNKDAKYYMDGGAEKVCSHITTRYDITKIYSSLGYPDLSDQEIADYYATLTTDIYFDRLPYSGNYINSTTAAGVFIDYQYIDNGISTPDYDNGDITYVAYLPNDYTLLSLDVPLSDPQIFHHVGGYFYESTRDYIADKAQEGAFEGQNLLCIMHHNLVPHFPLEDSLLKDFTVYGWREAADFLADLGVRYVFTGHMHSNDIAKHESLNGNVIIDTETASATGFKGGPRYIVLERGTVDGKYAENYKSKIALLSPVDVSRLFSDNYMNNYYIEFCGLQVYISNANSKHIITNPSEYAADKLFRNIVNNVKYTYLDPDFIADAASLLGGIIKSDSLIVELLLDVAGPIINSIIIHIEDVVLADYVYSGSNERYKGAGRGKKLCGYAEEMVDKVLDYKVNSRGDTLLDFGIGGYLSHQGGIDKSLQDTDTAILEGLENLKNGSIVKMLLDTLLSEDIGLLRLVDGLFLPIDLTKGATESEITTINMILMILSPAQYDIDASAVKIGDLVPNILELVEAIMGKPLIDMGDMTAQELIYYYIDGYITQSLYTGLGEIAYNIMHQFYIDETSALENSFGGYVGYKFDTAAPCTYVSNRTPEAPSIDNGKLPSMLTVTFGADPATTKNFVWFTDRRISDTEIQYNEGNFDAANAVQKSGSFAVYATTTPNIDLGIFATVLHVAVGRHTVELSDLKPATVYSYRVGSAAKGYWSDVFTFKTAPQDDTTPFEILLISDIQGSALRTYELASKIMAKVDGVFDNGYDFVLNCGDLVDSDKNLVQWKYLLDTMQGYWGNTTQVVANGNHDNSAYAPDAKKPMYSLVDKNAITDPYNYLLLHYNLSYPAQDNLTGAYYSFDYSGVHFTVLNTNNLASNNMLTSEQTQWLKADLAGTEKLKVVVMHKSIYSSGSHYKDADIVALRAQLTPIFNENGVHLVLAGHDHTYTESYYLDGSGEPVKSNSSGKNKIGTDGTLYITLGTFGDKFYKYIDNDDVPVAFGAKLHNPTLTNPTFGKLVFDGKDLYYYGYEYDISKDEIRPLGSDNLKLIIGLSALAVFVAGVSIASAVSIAKTVKRKKA